MRTHLYLSFPNEQCCISGILTGEYHRRQKKNRNQRFPVAVRHAFVLSGFGCYDEQRE